jgi:hypothetical protein
MAKISAEIEKTKEKYIISFDAEKFERMANVLGFFNPDFIKILKNSLDDYKKKKVKNIKNLYKKYK